MNEQDQQRQVRHRIAVLRHAAEVTGNVAQTCRYYGISRPRSIAGCTSGKSSVRPVCAMRRRSRIIARIRPVPRSWRRSCIYVRTITSGRRVLAVARTLGLHVFRVPFRLRIHDRVAPAKPAGSFVISEIHVLPEFRGQGIGDAMLHRDEAQARKLGYAQCALHTLASNPARRLYERHGYAIAMTTTDAQFEKLTGVSGNILYVKDLNST